MMSQGRYHVTSRSLLLAYENGIPVYFPNNLSTLRKCPSCKSKNIVKEIRVTRMTSLDVKTNKLVTKIVDDDQTGSGFDCCDCNLKIDSEGSVTFRDIRN
jgi:hypothetical protein